MSNFSEKTTAFKKKARKFLIKLSLILLLLTAAVFLFLYYANYSTGVRAGIVLKVSKKGSVFKTYEGQLDIMSFGAVKSQNQLSQTFDFSIYKSSPEVIEALETAALNGQRVNLRYEEKYAVLPWRGSTKHFVTGVEVLGNGATKEKDNKRFLE